MIFQSLDDLIDACRQAAFADNPRRDSQEFEVGVFNGQYVTPVPDGYFAHLERIRGENKKMKVIENARRAVADGSADDEEFQIALNGAEITIDGKIVPSSPAMSPVEPRQTNGDHSPIRAPKRKRTMDQDVQLGNGHDISIENKNDYAHDY